jgi:apolipoprotein N-acyltransferase
MSQTVTIGSNSFIIPNAGENPGWAEELTAYLVAIADALASVQGPHDILITSATLANNQTVPTNIPGLLFNTGEVQAIEIDYLVLRSYDSGSSTVSESGKILGNFDGTTFTIAVESVRDAGIDFSITNGGQVQYVSTNLSNHISSIIRFRGRTIDQP